MGVCTSRDQSPGLQAEWEARIAKVQPLPGPIQELRQVLGNRLQIPGDESYNSARGDPHAPGVAWDGKFRQTWNLDDVGFPSAIASVDTVSEVQAVVKYAAAHCLDAGTLLCVACGRHSHQSVLDNSLVLDLQRLNSVEVDPVKKLAKVAGGAQQGTLDMACEPHSLATTAGHNASTGCGGLILQGGHGFLERKFGLVVDNLVSAEVVLADGRLVEANASENSDLLWALKGGGGNFGVVVSFTLRLHELPPTYAGQRVHIPLGVGPFKSRAEIISRFFSKTVGGPDEAAGLIVLPGGGPVVEMLLWVGDASEGKAYFDSKNVGVPLLKNSMAITKYHSEVQRYYAPGNMNAIYQTGVLLPEVSDAVATKIAEFASCAPKLCLLILLPIGGKVNTVAPEDTAVAHRNMKVWVLVSAQFPPGNLDARAEAVKWARSVKQGLLPFSGGAQYGVLSEVTTHDAADGKNTGEFKLSADQDGGAIGCMLNTADTVAHRNIYGANLPRLQQLKLKYDPKNVFRVNDNIVPR